MSVLLSGTRISCEVSCKPSDQPLEACSGAAGGRRCHQSKRAKRCPAVRLPQEFRGTGGQSHRFPLPTAMITIPDSVEGAIIISIVDFILSFVIISGIGVVLALLPLVNRFWRIDDKDLKSGH